MSKGTPGVRYAEVEGVYHKVRVHVVLDLDGGTRRNIETGFDFFDTLLSLMATDGRFDVGVKVENEHSNDMHGVFPAVGVLLGQAIRHALEESVTSSGHGVGSTPSSEGWMMVGIDFNRIGQLYSDFNFSTENLSGIPGAMLMEFFRCLSIEAGISTHVKCLAGSNEFYLAKSLFRSFGAAMDVACRRV